MDREDVDLDSLPMLSDGEQSPDEDADLDSLPMLDDGEPDLVAETQAELGGAGDFAAGTLDGLLMNYGGELGEIGEGIGNLASGAPWSADGVNPVDDAQQTSTGTAGNMVGNVISGTALGIATGGVGGIAAQAGIQGGIGAVQGYGANHDPYEALISGGIGAAMGGGGRALAGKFAPRANQLDELPVPGRQTAEYPPVRMAQPRDPHGTLLVPGRGVGLPDEELTGAGMNWLDEGQSALGAADEALPPVWSEGPSQALLAPKEASWLQKHGGKLLDMAGGSPLRRPDRWLLAQAGKRLIPGSKKLGTMAVPDEQAVRNIMGNVGGASAVTGQRFQARPDLPTLVWGLQSVNASGDTGLPPQAQAKLDAALATGDDSSVSSTYMSLSMAYPAFQKRMQREIESINDEGE